VVVIDAGAGALAMNHSLAGSGGSGVMTEGMGFLYNNTMAGFDAGPGGRNAIAPGKARWSAACPTIAADATGRLHALTGPGGSRAFAAVVEVLLPLVGGMDPAAAVALPRFDVRGAVVDVEPRFGAPAREQLVADGWSVEQLPGPHVAAVYVASRHEDGSVAAAADPRWPGSALAQ
jgi:gamma-glutamyltranspeptidase/glutathione hydrolase